MVYDPSDLTAAVIPLVAGYSRTSINGSTADWRRKGRGIKSQLSGAIFIYNCISLV